MYLLAIFDGTDGIDIAEFSWVDEEQPDRCFRCWDFQWAWYTNEDMLQIDQAGRSLGKSTGVQMRAFAFPFNYPGSEMLITAPELNHLRPLTDAVENRILATRMSREMLPKRKGNGLARQPHWQASFANGARIISRLPNKDGRGVKGMHPTVLEGDEMQDFPLAGWIELIETHKRGSVGSQVRFHGVSRGVRDKYWELTQPDSDFTVHRYMAQHRPTWTDQERTEKMKLYQSRQSVDYKRNIYGEHGDASNPVFVLAKLMNCVDTDEGSTYNTEVYQVIRVDFEQIEKGREIISFLDPPGEHLHGYSQFVTPDLDNGKHGAPRQVGAPNGYSAYFGGMDVGVTNHPSEILIFGQRKGTDVVECLLRINMRRIGTEDQIAMIEGLFEFYGSKLKAFALDKTGVGQPIWDILNRKASIGDRIYGYNFSEKVVTGYQDRELGPTETQEDLAIWRNVVEASTDTLRNDMVDVGRIRLPFDRELLSEWQGQNYCCDTKTEILTKRGWLRYDEVEEGDETLGLSEDMTFDWTPIGAVTLFLARPREMIHLLGQAHDSVTTADHGWLARPYDHAKKAVWALSEDLLGPTSRFCLPMAGRPTWKAEEKYDDDFVELVAWFFTEGHRLFGGKIGIAQSPTANPTNVARIETLLERLLGPGNRDIGQGRRGPGRWSVTTAKRPGAANDYVLLDRELCARLVDVTDADKVVSPEFLAQLTLDQLGLFIDVAVLADGCEFARRRAGKSDTAVRTFAQKHQGRSDSFQMACALVGQAQQTVRRRDGIWMTTLTHRTQVHVSSLKRLRVTESLDVWCPTTGTGTWLARRNGRVYFTGNTVVKSNGSPYGKRDYSAGKFHTLDAGKMMAAGKTLPLLAAMLEKHVEQKPVYDLFLGASY